MIKLPFEKLQKYKKKHFRNLKESVSGILAILPSPYDNLTDKKGDAFLFDLLTNPFESKNLFLKEYYLAVKFIIDCSGYIDDTKKLSSLLPKKIIATIGQYFGLLDVNSIFKKIYQYSNNPTYDDLKKHIELLKQFIANKKDRKNSTTTQYQELEDDLELRLLADYSNYLPLRKFMVKIKKMYDQKKFNDSRINLISALGIKVCPYCNRQFIDIFKRKKYKDSVAIAQLDHFYPRADFPLYAISLYNFVPSCAKCNSLKSNNLSSYIYPYSYKADEENKEQYFELEFNSYDEMRGVGTHKPTIVLAFKDKEKINNANALFHRELYANHSDFSQRLLRIQRLDNSEYRNSINSYFQDYKLTESDLQELLYGFNGSDNELLEKPLSKLAQDVINFTKKD